MGKVPDFLRRYIAMGSMRSLWNYPPAPKKRREEEDVNRSPAPRKRGEEEEEVKMKQACHGDFYGGRL